METDVQSEPLDLANPNPSAEPESVEESPLAAHEATFGKQPPDAAPTLETERPRHRAQSQRAKPSDVDDIRAFTARLKEAEDAIQIDRKDGESDRVYNLRRRAEIAELAKTYRSQPAPATTPKETPRVFPSEPSAQPAAAVSEKFSFDSFEAYAAKHPEIQPAQMWDAWEADKLDARDAWKDAKSAADKQAQSAKASEAETVKAIQARQQSYTEKLTAYTKQYPERTQTFQNIPPVSPLMLEAIWSLDNAPDVVYTLRSTPGLFAQVALQLEGKPLTPQNVALATDWLQSRMPAGTTGSVASTPIRSTPRPPNPVRTGPIASGDEYPGDVASIADHEKFYGKRRRR